MNSIALRGVVKAHMKHLASIEGQLLIIFDNSPTTRFKYRTEVSINLKERQDL